jgi:hypothetical protein
VKCSHCQLELLSNGVVITLVFGDRAFTATMHDRCLVEMIGAANARKLRNCAFDSGWAQEGLPGFRDRG